MRGDADWDRDGWWSGSGHGGGGGGGGTRGTRGARPSPGGEPWRGIVRGVSVDSVGADAGRGLKGAGAGRERDRDVGLGPMMRSGSPWCLPPPPLPQNSPPRDVRVPPYLSHMRPAVTRPC
jgi:hypothetical protein